MKNSLAPGSSPAAFSLDLQAFLLADFMLEDEFTLRFLFLGDNVEGDANKLLYSKSIAAGLFISFLFLPVAFFALLERSSSSD